MSLNRTASKISYKKLQNINKQEIFPHVIIQIIFIYFISQIFIRSYQLFFQKNMGGGSSKNKKQVKVNWDMDKNWQYVATEGNHNIVRNGNVQGQEYLYTLDNKYSLAEEKKIHNLRRTSNLPIVHTLDSEGKATGTFLAPKTDYRVVTQRVPYLLTGCPQLHTSESLYVLDKSLQGYKGLYEKVGAFYVNSDMIGFTPEGEARVWLSENFGENRPSHNQNVLISTLRHQPFDKTGDKFYPITNDQNLMVRNIVNVIEDKTEQGRFPAGFKAALSNPGIGFDQARAEIRNCAQIYKYPYLNKIDLYNNTIRTFTTNFVSRPQVINEVKYEQTTTIPTSTIQPVQFIQAPPPVVTSSAIPVQRVSQPPVVVSTLKTSYVQPVRTTTEFQGASFTNSYKPMPSAKNSSFKFNYVKPKQYFHPDMYTGPNRY